ncbi:hypothetical protein [Aurantiacibacter gangjinensis]|nr:hypothetical protein [Aurantiacibacter gangjinensis]
MLRYLTIIAALPMAVVGTVAAMPSDAAAQRLPRIQRPSMPSVPSMPQLPTTDRVTRDAPTATPQQQPRGRPMDRRSGQNGMQDFMNDMNIVAQGVTPTDGSSQAAGDAEMDRLVTAYEAAVDRLAARNYPGLPPQMVDAQMREVQMHYDRVAEGVDDQIEWATTRVSANGGTNERMPILAYNQLLAIGVEMDGATTLFPGNATYSAAKNRIDAELARLGSRDGAGDAFEASALAEAANVRMPASIDSSSGAIAQFRQGWATGGIDYTIMAIHVTSGWSDKFVGGRRVGQTRDAAIAARSPSDPDRCNLYSFTIFRDLGGAIRRDSHSTTRIACENVPG